MNTPPINTHVRLFDLVRYSRATLHQDNLITDEEYAWLCAEADIAKGPGSPSRQRLEDYDDLRAELTRIKEELAVARVKDESNRRTLESTMKSHRMCLYNGKVMPVELAEHMQRHSWQPITTAPRDGTKIDLWMPSGHRVTKCYWGRPSHSCGEFEGYCDSCPDHDGWVDGEDFMNGYTDQQPTHWMLMPTAPATAAEPIHATSWHTQPPVNPVSQVNPVQTAPETFESHGHTWTRHTPGDPCPVPYYTLVYVLTSLGGPSQGSPSQASNCGWKIKNRPHTSWGEIIGWRYATPPAQESPRDTRDDHQPWTEPDRSGGGGHTTEEIRRAAGEVW